MEINVSDLKCEKISDTMFNCVADAPNTPWWFYPVVLACFVIALSILVLVARMTYKSREPRDRRVLDLPVEVDQRRP